MTIFTSDSIIPSLSLLLKMFSPLPFTSPSPNSILSRLTDFEAKQMIYDTVKTLAVYKPRNPQLSLSFNGFFSPLLFPNILDVNL